MRKSGAAGKTSGGKGCVLESDQLVAKALSAGLERRQRSNRKIILARGRVSGIP